jgi:hypothetical protein
VIDALLALKAITDTGTLPAPDTLAGHRRLIVSAAPIGASPEASRLGRSAAPIAPWPAASAGAWTTTCASPPTCAFHSTTIRLSATSG